MKLIYTIAVFLLINTIVYSQTDLSYYLPQNVTYNQNIPTPKSVIGHEVGEWHITHDKLVHYMYTLANATDRITIENRGTTFEGRPILLLTITSPKNHQNLEQIREAHIASTNGNDSNASNRPIVVYQGYSIHGNEPSGANAGMLVAYYLAAAEDTYITELLDNTVILFDPSFNPDGLQRFAYWANTNKSKNLNPDPNDREYREVWPGGRTNHYWFDLNRDWLPVQMPESRARLVTFHKWLPNILTDHHEMGSNSTFFFQPGVQSRTHPLTPKMNQELTKKIGNFHAKALDKIGSLYFTEENYDDFYYGKGSTFPDINGSIGILFEQGSSRGHLQETSNGVLTFPFTIRNQFTAALSTLEAAKTMRIEILNYQNDFYKNARSEASRENGKTIVFGDEKDAAKTYHLAEILKRHNIQFNELKNDVGINGKQFKKGYSYVVPKNQKQHRLINAIFEKRTKFQDSLFYDVSAWTFPMAFNLDYTEEAKTNLIGPEVTKLMKRPSPKPQMSNYAYLMEWHDYYAPKALYMILQKGLRAKVGMKKFSIDGREYDYGTILIPVQNQKLSAAEISEVIHEINDITHVSFSNVETGLTSGIDLGSNQFRNVELPKVAMIIGDGINSYDAGEIWHLFDQRFKMLITKIDAEDFINMDIGRYTDIIIPNSRGSALDKKDSEKLKSWVEKGGTLIGYKNVGKWLDNQKLLKMNFTSKKDTATAISFEQVRNFQGAQAIGGAIFETKLDRSHPIAFGYKNSTLPVFRNSTLFLTPDANSYKNPIQYTSTPLLSGYISNSNLAALQNTSAFKTGRIGRGRVIYFTDNHNFRAFWYGTNKLLMNAIFFGDEM